VKGQIFYWLLCLGLVAAALRAAGEAPARGEVVFAARSAAACAPRDGGLHPIKKRVGRAVTSTMEKIDNPWFIMSQILIPLCAFLFSLMYVRRYRARRAAESAPATAALGAGAQQAPLLAGSGDEGASSHGERPDAKERE